MKSTFTFLLVVLSQFLIAQVAISPTKMNVAYIGVDNPLMIVANGIDCDSLRIEVSQGELEKREYCTYDFRPIQVGENIFSIYHKDTLIKQIGFRIKRIPDPIASIGGMLMGGTIQKSTLAAQLGIVAKLWNFTFDIHFNIVSFEMTTCDGTGFYNLKTKGPLFTHEMRNLIKNAATGQYFDFHSIKVQGVDGITRKIGSINYKVTAYGDYDKPNCCQSDCYVFYKQIDYESKDLEYGKICNEDTIFHFIEKTRDSIFIIENQLKNEREVYQLDKDGDYFGRYEKWEKGNLTIEGLYDKISHEIDSIWQIDPITLLDTVVEIPVYKSVRHGTWKYYSKKGKLKKQEIYDFDVLRE